MLPPPPRRRAFVEEVPDEDNISILTHHSQESDLVDDDNPEEDLQNELERETASGTAAYLFSKGRTLLIVNSALAAESPLPDGKLCEAPSVAAALKDLKDMLRPHRKTGRGYIDPGIDPFICV
jgi:hypothetical protein